MSKLDYLLKAKDLSETISKDLQNIINTYLVLKKNMDNFFKLNNDKVEDDYEFYISTLQHLYDVETNVCCQMEIIHDKIDKVCKHYYIQDLIDIDPDNSKIIYYCSNCGKMRPE